MRRALAHTVPVVCYAFLDQQILTVNDSEEGILCIPQPGAVWGHPARAPGSCSEWCCVAPCTKCLLFQVLASRESTVQQTPSSASTA